ncbi:MAG TPA: D-alanyl-D-alanine carboxypeptidase/D-alanyl-D-alanine-endopeptidase [Nocardioides sp.]|nr:D-alanyl-D-alanine carboxypeptidase/D-alanyl-D-alanine-endopeptidase [Nocardioides sp.]
MADVASGVRRKALVAIPTVLALVVAVAGLVGWRTGRLDDWWHQVRGDDAVAGPAAVAPPQGVEAPDVVRPDVVAQPVTERALNRARIAAALARPLAKPALGSHVLAAVGTLDGPGLTYRSASSGSFLATPASTTKLVTTTTALFALGPAHTFDTTTVLTGAGAKRRLVLVGGGDPYLASAPQQDDPSPTYDLHRADVATLAARTAAVLRQRGIRSVRLGYDDSLFSGPSVNTRWEDDYVSSGEVAPTSALWVDEGHDAAGDSIANPPATATAVFRKALVRRGITVTGASTPTVAPSGASPVAKVTSAPLAQVVQRILQVSDNDGAEVLLRQLGIAEEGQGSIAAGRVAVKKVLAANGIPLQGTVLYDGSGLSRQDLMSPNVLVGVLRLAASSAHPELRPIIEGLPVAGYNGSLAESSGGPTPQGWGRVRAKTGTLTGVTALAGIGVDRSGDPMVFVLMADRVPVGKDALARQWRDQAASALGACRCG